LRVGQKQPRRSKLRKEIRYQLDCVGKSIATISNILLAHGLEDLPEKRIARQDNAERNMVEGRYGIAKRRYCLARIMDYLPETGKTQAAMQFLCMNMDVRLRALACFIFSLAKPFLYASFSENHALSHA